MPGIQRFIRLDIQGVIYEASEDDNGEPIVRVKGEPLGDAEFELSEDDVDNLLSFLEEFQDLGQGQQSGRGTQSRQQDSDNGSSGYRGRTVPYRGRGTAGRGQDERPVARNMDGTPDKRTGPRAEDDTRGKVLDPEHDGRLKGNEQFRPNDPDREGNRAGGRRGGNRNRRNEE